jgi:hypothetical protein
MMSSENTDKVTVMAARVRVASESALTALTQAAGQSAAEAFAAAMWALAGMGAS